MTGSNDLIFLYILFIEAFLVEWDSLQLIRYAFWCYVTFSNGLNVFIIFTNHILRTSTSIRTVLKRSTILLRASSNFSLHSSCSVFCYPLFEILSCLSTLRSFDPVAPYDLLDVVSPHSLGSSRASFGFHWASTRWSVSSLGRSSNAISPAHLHLNALIISVLLRIS